MHERFTPTRIIFIGFLILMLVGTFLLMLPISSKSNISFTDALFTSVSATCVTGLITMDTNTAWTFFGQAVILVLIQIGGLGIMSIFTVFSILIGRKLNLTERLAIGESINEFNLDDVIKIFFKILRITLFFELLGAIIIFTEIQSIYGTVPSIWKSIFLAISSFCNAGFDLFGTASNSFQSLTSFADKPLLLVTVSSLFIIGGLGFIVWKDIWSYKLNFKKYSLHSKLVIISTVILLIFPSFFIYFFEKDNSLSALSSQNKAVNSFFCAASPRTAGFSSLNTADFTSETKFLTTILMIIGAAPGSTAGGIKVTTVVILLLASLSFIRGKEDIQILKKNISGNTVFKSICIFMLAIILIVFGTFCILCDSTLPFEDTLFEVSSAFGTVGLSTGITPLLNSFSKIILIIMMFLGRLGPLTMVIAFSHKQIFHKSLYKYAEGKVSVG